MTSASLQTSLAVDFDDKATDAWFKIMQQAYILLTYITSIFIKSF